ncbi:response regulator [Flavobacterium succinicans]|uniref:histidine kinase n=1 Tax=Flavobacterium succinicans TaxID=29536 RepID=A0A199XTR5_9FLAO|nr:response regulator [Flavobacterium succinicans]OAZ05153.1 autoinducer 2 sensor kinase/phosphatase LuxQ [Flavobacterium succinicans]
MLPNQIVLVFVLLFGNVSFIAAQNDNFERKELIEQSVQATNFFHKKDFEKSLLLSRDILKKALTLKDTVLIAASYSTIGSNYNEISEFDKSIEYYKKALFYANKTLNDTLKFKANNNLGNLYCFEKREYKIGIQYYKRAIFYSKRIPNSTYTLLTTLNLAWAYFDDSNFEDGLEYLLFSNANFTKYGSKTLSVVHQMVNGMYFAHIGNYTKARDYYVKAIALGYKYNELNDVSYSHNEFSKMLFKMGNYKEAYIHLRKFDDLKEKIYNEDKLIKASITGLNVELDEYKRELSKIELIKESQNQNLRKSKIIVILFVIVLFILLILIFTLIRNNSFKRKLNRELTIANNDLLLAKEKAEEASQMKSQFVSTISHELRTPLYGVIGITNMLIDEYKDLSTSPHLNSLKFSARYLLSLVNDILQINKIEENRIVLESMTFNISDEIEMIIRSLSFLSQTNKNKVELLIDPKIPEYLIGDKLRFSQILMNLISNALKFTKKGTITITATLEKTEEKLNYIGFKIKDTGVGIAAIDQDKIFDKFVQVGRNDTDYQGTGLGLSIVKRLLHLFGSDITLVSALGEGTTFSFCIPFESDLEKTNEIINNIRVDLSSSQIFNVLVVEDNRINQLVTQKIMEKNHYKCCVVDDGQKALKMLEKESFDIILMDINMPFLNGFETTRLIRNKNIQTPIIALTAFDKEEIAEEALSAGLNDIIIKPFDQLRLFKVMSTLIQNAKNVG